MAATPSSPQIPPDGGGAVALELTPFDRVYRGILRGLYEGRFVPGQRLVEPDLMQEFGVGRGTIREVLNRLTAAGVVLTIRHRGALVRLLTKRDVEELLDLVELMVGLAARRGAERVGNGEDSAPLAAAYARLRSYEEVEDFAAFSAAREDYYRAMVRLSGNHELARIFPGVQVQIMRLQLRHFGRAAEGIEFKDYARLTQAIVSGDPDAAEAAGRLHVRHVRESVSDLPDRAFGREDAPPG